MLELLDRLEAAEKDSAHHKALAESVLRVAKGWEDKCNELRAKLETMEKQEPVAWLHETRRDYDVVTDDVKRVWEKAVVGALADYSIPLYLAPGAQPAPIIPEGWKPIPEKHPTFDLVDLRLADGSVLCGCIPQSDGDYWWDGPSGEVFIDPKYAPVTHWRLSVAQEAKP